MLRRMLGFVGAAALSMIALPQAASAQLFFTDPPIERGIMEPGDPLVGLPLNNANPAEQRAALLWNFRAAMNVAALQCQFSRYLRTVDNYNAFGDHHSVELLAAYRTLEGYFRRTRGAAGQRELDVWSTRTYNGFTSLTGQVSFCQTAADAGRDALQARKGSLLDVARTHMRGIRSALRANRDYITPFAAPYLAPLPASLFGNACAGLSGRDLRRCERD